MRLAGLQKLTLLDYPGKTAATAFTPGCNLRCPFCHNKELVLGAACGEKDADRLGARDADRLGARDADPPGARGAVQRWNEPAGKDAIECRAFPMLSVDSFFAFLETRKGLLDGVCITGGEPLLQHDIDDFCRSIKDRGFLVKLDTNGSFPERLQHLVEEGLVDYVAMDVKNSPAAYGRTVGIAGFDIAPIDASIAYLLGGPVEYEFRTTVIREFHDRESLRALASWIEGADAWFLQNFVDSVQVLIGEDRLHGFTVGELKAFLPELQQIVANTSIRGQ